MRVPLAVLVLLAALPAAAAPPALLLNHNGRLLDADDKPAQGPVKLHVELHTLFASGPGDQVVWQDDFANVMTDKNGAYALMLGETQGGHHALTPEMFQGDRWLAVTVNDVPLAPWMRVGMLPLAAHATDSDTLGGKSLTDLDLHFAALDSAEPQTGALRVTGDVAAAHFVGDGSRLTAVVADRLNGPLPADQLSGTIADARLSPNVALLGGSATFAGNVAAPQFNGRFVGDGSGLTGLPAAQLTGTIDTARLPAGVAFLNTPPSFNGALSAPSGSFANGVLVGSYAGTSVDPAGGLLVSGKVGVGTTTPAVKLDVAGEIRVGNASTACAANTEGAIRYDTAAKKLEFCNGTDWLAINSKQFPDPVSFTAVPTAALSSTVTSNTVTLANFDAALPVSVSGSGAPKLRVNAGSWVSSATANPGDQLTLQLTTPGTYQQATTVTVTIGTFTTTWTVTTIGQVYIVASKNAPGNKRYALILAKTNYDLRTVTWDQMCRDHGPYQQVSHNNNAYNKRVSTTAYVSSATDCGSCGYGNQQCTNGSYPSWLIGKVIYEDGTQGCWQQDKVIGNGTISAASTVDGNPYTSAKSTIGTGDLIVCMEQ